MKIRYILMVLIVLYIAALSVRLVPLATSHIPYNLDSLLETRISQDIVNSGGLSYPADASYVNQNHDTITPMYNVFLAISSVLLGAAVDAISPVMIPILTSFTIIITFIIVLKMTSNKYAALGAGVFLALSGTYVTVTLAPWKEAFGIFFLPIIIYLYVNRKEDVRIRGLAVFLLILLPLIHHLVTIIVYLTITFITIIPSAERFIRRKISKDDKLDISILFILWIFVFAYYSLSNFNRMTLFNPESGLWLFFSVFCIMFLIGVYTARKTPTKWYLVLAAPIITLAIFFINIFVPIFPYTIGTKKTLLLYILPYLLLLFPLVIGFSVVLDSSSKYRVFLISLFLAPFTIILFAFLWGLNPTTSYPMIVRTYDFLDIGIAVTIGIGIAYMIRKLKSKNIKTALGALFIITVLATTPIAYNTKEIFDIQNVTYDYEVDTLHFIKEKNIANMNVTTDSRIYEMGQKLYDLNGDFELPYYIQQKQSLQKDKLCIMEAQWMSSPGAQMYPLDSVVLSKSDVNNLILPDNNLLVSSGPTDNMVYVMVSP